MVKDFFVQSSFQVQFPGRQGKSLADHRRWKTTALRRWGKLDLENKRFSFAIRSHNFRFFFFLELELIGSAKEVSYFSNSH